MSEYNHIVSSIVGTAGAFSVMSGAWIKLRKIQANRHKAKEEAKQLEKAIIIQEAKEVAHKHKVALESKIAFLEKDLEIKFSSLSQEIASVKESFEKDLTHVKESYTSEVKFLGNKIEELKDDLRSQMGQIVTLVSKLIEKD